MRRVLSVGVLCGLLPMFALAAETSFTDVPDGTWYTPAVKELVEAGHIDGTQKTFRPGVSATRAEFLKLTMRVAKMPSSTPPMIPSFDDVPKTAWYFALFEDAAKESLSRGDNNCYGSHPCRAFPERAITRAQAAALFVRAFVIERTGRTSIRFIDVGDSDWFAYAMYAAADHCILRGDNVSLRIRPQDPVTRAEMAVMFQRLSQIRLGKDICPKSASS